jgi:Ca2+-binding EF-hand superfamily protein
MMASKMTSTEDEIRQCFQVFDKNQDEYIEAAELKQGLVLASREMIWVEMIWKVVMESLGEKLTQKELDAMIHELDEENLGKVSYSAFVKMAEGRKMWSPDAELSDCSYWIPFWSLVCGVIKISADI